MDNEKEYIDSLYKEAMFMAEIYGIPKIIVDDYYEAFVEFVREEIDKRVKTGNQSIKINPEVFLKDAFDISKLYNYFLSTPYSEIEEEKKSKFIDKINTFLEKYSENNFLQRLNYCVKEQFISDEYANKQINNLPNSLMKLSVGFEK